MVKTRADALAKVQERIAELETDLSNSQALLVVTEKKVIKFQKAAKKGQCPHCGEYFSDLHRHVQRRHA